jgi:hypothetical protein
MNSYVSEDEWKLRAAYEQECKEIEAQLARIEEAGPTYWELQAAIKENNRALSNAYRRYRKALDKERQAANV